MRTWVLVCMLVWGVAAAHAEEQGPSPQGNKKPSLGMVTGSETGTYYHFGQDIHRILANEDIEILVKDSTGSIDNINRIASSENAALGIVQSDVLGYLIRSREPKSHEIGENLRMVFPLYREEVHVIANRAIKRFGDLQNKIVVVGPTGSGSWLTSLNLFGITGVRPEQMLRLSPEEGLVAVLTGKADAMIFVAGKPVKLFRNLEGLKMLKDYASLLGNLHFLALDDARMLKEYGTSIITPADYDFVDRSVPTLTVSALLVSYNFHDVEGGYAKTRCEDLKTFGAALRRHIEDLKQSGHPKWREVSLDTDIGFWRRDRCSSPATSSAVLENELLHTLDVKW